MKRNLIEKRASTLLIAILMMGVLIVASFSINTLLIKEIRSHKDLYSGMKAYFNAEAGVETALLKNADGDFSTDGYSYSVIASGDSLPCEFEAQTETGYGIIPENDYLIVPISDQFSVDFKYQNGTSADSDALRWKIYGKDNDGEVGVIGDYLPVTSTSTFLGTGTQVNNINYGKFHRKVGAVEESNVIYGPEDLVALGAGDFEYSFDPMYSISDFLNSFTDTYLVLLNLPQEGVSGDILYKIESAEGEKLSCASVFVKSKGIADGDYSKFLEVMVPRAKGMLINHFALVN